MLTRPILTTRKLFLVLTAAALLGATPPASAASVIDEWSSIQRPAPPALKPVTLDAKTTALLMLDFMNQNCAKRPRCVATVPAMKALLEKARAAKATVIYSLIRNSTAADVIKDVAPAAGEASVTSGPDKFLNTDLEKILKEKGITTVITVGTAANGAVLFTAAGAAFRGLNVVIPVDGISSADAYADLSMVWNFTTAPTLSQKATLTGSDMIGFK
jgi:nicotinamidase-related amidase